MPLNASAHPFTHPFDLAKCFSPDYAEARRRFLSVAKEAGGSLRAYDNPLTGPQGEALATDIAWFGPKDARKVLVLQSATHGVEGFTGSGAILDWLHSDCHQHLPVDTAVMLIHAINPHGFAWLRRVTEENVDLNRNFVDFDRPLPENPGHDDLADALVPRALCGPVFEAAEKKIEAWREKHGDRAFSMARGGGQYKHAHSMFYGGVAPTWSRRTLETLIADYDLPSREQVAIIDYHTGLGPFGYGEPICSHREGTAALARAKRWYGQSVTEPAAGTSSSVPKVGLNEWGWESALGERATFVAIEYGTYTPERGRLVLREDHWLHAYSNVDWSAPETQRIKQQIRDHFYPDTDDWREMVLFRSRQVVRQATEGLAGA